jgi:hypothetical protein
MKYYVDPMIGTFLWRCPECGQSIRLKSESAVCLAARAGRCQGCRAKATFQQNPGLVGFFLEYWARTDSWPLSDSWVEFLPALGVSILGSANATARASSLAGPPSAGMLVETG